MTLPFTGERCVPGATPGDVFEQHANRYRLAARAVATDSTVIDIGSGSGIGAALLATVARQVIGIELDSISTAFARRQFASSTTNLAFARGDVQRLPIPDAVFDAATAFEVIEHVPDPDRLLDEVQRVLRPKGMFFASTPDGRADRYLPNPYHVSRRSEQEFRRDLEKRFTVEAAFYQGVVTRRRLLSLQLQSILSAIPEGAKLLGILHAAFTPHTMIEGDSPQVFALSKTINDRWPLVPLERLPAGALPYIVVFQCRKR